MANSATKSFFGGITGTLGVFVGLFLILCLCCTSIGIIAALGSDSNKDSSADNTNTEQQQEQPANEENSQASEQPAAPTEPITLTFSGSGNKDTESFTLHSGSAKMSATTSGSTYGSYSYITLEKEGENSFLNGLTGANLNISTEGSEAGNGDTTVRGIEEGTYFVSVISGVDWTVTVTQE